MKDEIVALVEKAERYLRSAALLHTTGDYDSAASRLYYAMFYCAEAVLLTKELTFSRHRGVIAGFGQHFIKTGALPVEMHQWLREAFDKRQLGDYAPLSPLEEEDSGDLQVKAQRFIQHTKAFLQQGESPSSDE